MLKNDCVINRRFIKFFLLLPLIWVAGTVPSSGTDQAEAINPGFYEYLERFHGHTCPGSLMGARLGFAAKAALKAAGGEGKVKAKFFSLSCPVDGIQAAAGTTYGNRDLEIEDKDEMRLLLTAEKNGLQVEARLTSLAVEKGKKPKELKKKARELPAGSPERQRLEKEAEEILTWFRTAPEKDVVLVRVVK
ncbi:MAG: formylmethanofuran dehydrogenase subunit E family protein [Elusimicrobiales bacterium]